jgi:hypothetical protein
MPMVANRERHPGEHSEQYALSRNCEALFEIHSSIVRTVNTGSSGSRSWTLRRTAGSTDFGSPVVRTAMSISGSTRVLIERVHPHVPDHPDHGEFLRSVRAVYRRSFISI